MASTITLGELRDACKDRSDMQNSNFISTSEWNRYINSASKELYDILVSKGLQYNIVKYTLAVDGVEDTFDLPSDFYKLEGVDYQINSKSRPMMNFNFIDRNKYQDNDLIVRYRLVGEDKIMFTPRPSAQTFSIWYIPAFEALSNDNETFNGINGWEEYVIVRAAIWALQKEESDASDLKQDLMYLKQRIEEMSENRDQGLPGTVSDVRGAINYDDEILFWSY